MNESLTPGSADYAIQQCIEATQKGTLRERIRLEIENEYLRSALLKWSDGKHMQKSSMQTCMKLIDPNRSCSCGLDLAMQEKL